MGLGEGLGVGHAYKFIRIGELIKFVCFSKNLTNLYNLTLLLYALYYISVIIIIIIIVHIIKLKLKLNCKQIMFWTFLGHFSK